MIFIDLLFIFYFSFHCSGRAKSPAAWHLNKREVSSCAATDKGGGVWRPFPRSPSRVSTTEYQKLVCEEGKGREVGSLGSEEGEGESIRVQLSLGRSTVPPFPPPLIAGNIANLPLASPPHTQQMSCHEWEGPKIMITQNKKWALRGRGGGGNNQPRPADLPSKCTRPHHTLFIPSKRSPLR